MKKKILVIEDDKAVLDNISIILEEEGYLVHTATNGETGIEKANEIIPDLIICDISMPLKDGYQVLESLSKNKTTKRIPFVFLTAKVEKEDFRKGMALGADDYIFKPFTIDDLLNSVKLRIEKREDENQEYLNREKSEKLLYEIDDKILIKFNKVIQNICIKDLKFLKSKTPYILIKCRSGKSTLLRDTLDKWELKLPTKLFLRIHRNAIINMDFISKIEKFSASSYIIHLQDESEPFVISKRYAARIKDKFIL
ncbi:MAG: hypothetical protein CO129_01480 [Ignavibacteriales bacterium CG_4_9_14_3_um_filter_34_10]|nr:MAG: hypothetical protein CO129_01480 [Ignavibacteriales bacterium CG_4_9_14_3_um_filter_34_10]